MALPPIYSGPGLLRSGSTFSVNPNLSLQTLYISNKLGVPQPVNPSDAASKTYVDDTISSHGVVAGNGIVLGSDHRTISLSQNVALNSLTITGVPSDNDYVVTKAYVDKAVLPLAATSYVQSSLSNVATTQDVASAIANLTTRAYVVSLVENYVTFADLTLATADFPNRTDLENAVQDKATVNYVDAAVKNVVKTVDLQNALQPYVNDDLFRQSISEFVTEATVDDKLTSLRDEVSIALDTKMSSLVTKDDVDQLTANLTTTQYVDDKIAPFAFKSYVDKRLIPLADESYVDDRIAPLATTDYVDTSVENLSNYVSSYVDETIRTASFPVIYPVQHVQPTEDQTVESDGSTVLVLDPTSPLSNIRVVFPSDVQDGTYWIITTTRNIYNIIFSNLTTSGDVSSSNRGLTAGSSFKWVYSNGARGWLSL